MATIARCTWPGSWPLRPTTAHAVRTTRSWSHRCRLGLKELTAPLAEFVRFFQLDRIPGAGRGSSERTAAPRAGARAGCAHRPPAAGRVRRVPAPVGRGRAAAGAEIQSALAGVGRAACQTPGSPTRRTWAELRETAERLRQAEECRQQAEAEARRIKDLQDFAPAPRRPGAMPKR